MRAPKLLAIVNVTPDSFSDGGRYFSPADAVEQAERLIDEGADALDLGAESTRPGAAPVDAEEEWRRLEPVLRALRASHPALPLSIDTMKAAVAGRALDAGATFVNDVSGGADPAMFPLIARSGCDFVLMHLRGTPATMQSLCDYPDGVAAGVRAELRAARARAGAAGIAKEKVIIDPGLGFAKTAAQSVELLGALPEFVAEFGAVLLGASRKSFIRELDPRRPGPDQRLPGSLAAALIGAGAGVRWLRVHDVAETRQALAVWEAATKS